jgi:tRNA A-37 threonylcarbamoyl transferase component Bud32/TolB-like protein
MYDLLMRLAEAIGERYAVELEIGSGGMATVFLAEDRKHHRKVAIKVLHPELAAAIGPERFLREIDAVAGLTHPHVLPLYDSGEARGLLYFIMPYVEGESLAERLEREGQLPVEDAIRIAIQVADALDHAHRHGMVHCDVKPANILLEEGHAVVSDFGVACAIGAADFRDETTAGLIVGTPDYMSPEQATSDEVDGRSDLYALGCVLYEMLAGEPPLTGPSPQATLAARLTQTPTPLTAIRDTVPEWLNDVVERLLAKSAADRFQTGEELRDALRSSRPQPEGWSRRPNRNLYWALALAVAVLTAAVFASRWIAVQRARQVLAVEPRRIAVLRFENLTPDPALDQLEEEVAERITRRLHRERVGEVLPRSTVSGLIGSGGRDEVRTVASATGAGLVITGSFEQIGDSLGFVVRVVDGVSGTLKGSFQVMVGPDTDRERGLQELASRTAGGILFSFDCAYPAWSLAIFPTVRAYRLHEEGFDLSTGRRFRDALARYLEAWAQDSTFWLAQYSAVGAYHGLGDVGLADSLNRVIGERYRPGMSEVQRYHYDGTRAWFERDLETAIRMQRRVVRRLPDSWVVRHLLASYCCKANRWREVVETMQEAESHLTHDPASAFEHLRILSDAHHVLGEHEIELQVARKIERLGMGSTLERAYYRARALAALGRTESVMNMLDRVASMSDDTPLAGRVMLAVALELRAHDRRDAASRALGRTIHWLESRSGRIESDRDHAIAYGVALYHAGFWIASDSVLGGIGPSPSPDVDVIGYRGLLAARRSDEDQAHFFSSELERIGRRNHNSRAQTWAYRARISAVLGDTVRAVQQLKRAFDEYLDYQPTHSYEHQYRFDFEDMANYAPYEELLEPKG